MTDIHGFSAELTQNRLPKRLYIGQKEKNTKYYLMWECSLLLPNLKPTMTERALMKVQAALNKILLERRETVWRSHG
jgi:hypothetical protein